MEGAMSVLAIPATAERSGIFSAESCTRSSLSAHFAEQVLSSFTSSVKATIRCWISDSTNATAIISSPCTYTSESLNDNTAPTSLSSSSPALPFFRSSNKRKGILRSTRCLTESLPQREVM